MLASIWIKWWLISHGKKEGWIIIYAMSSFAIPPRFLYPWNLPVLLTILSPCDWFYYTHRAKLQPKINECAFSIPSSRLLLGNTKKNNKNPINIETKTFLMQGNHNFTRHAPYKVCPSKRTNEGIWPIEKGLFPWHKGVSLLKLWILRSVPTNRKLFLLNHKGVWQLCPQFSPSPSIIPFLSSLPCSWEIISSIV